MGSFELSLQDRTRLIGVVRAVAGDRCDAEDLAHDAIVRACAARESFDTSRPLGPWLNTIARRVTFDAMRRMWREPTRALSTLRSEPLAPDEAEATEKLERETRLLAAVRNALAQLPEREREVFCLFYEGGLSVRQISARLRTPVGTVKSWLHRSRERLRVTLAQLKEDC